MFGIEFSNSEDIPLLLKEAANLSFHNLTAGEQLGGKDKVLIQSHRILIREYPTVTERSTKSLILQLHQQEKGKISHYTIRQDSHQRTSHCN